MMDITLLTTVLIGAGCGAFGFFIGKCCQNIVSSSKSTVNGAAAAATDTRSKKINKSKMPLEIEKLADILEDFKMVLVVRNDLKMGKGKIAAQCSHATLGLYKKILHRAPKALQRWEMCGQVKVVVKIESEEDMLSLQERAKSLHLPTHVTIDAGRTQIAPNSRTVMAVLEFVKENAMKRNNRLLRNLTLLMEVVLCLILMLLVSWSTTPLNMYAGYLRELSVSRFSTHSVFIIGNLIILLVVFQSANLSGRHTPTHHKLHLPPHQNVCPESPPRVASPLHDSAVNSTDQLGATVNFDDRESSYSSKEIHLIVSSPRSCPASEVDEEAVEKQLRKNVVAKEETVTSNPESSQLYRRTLSASYERGLRTNRTPLQEQLRRSKTVKWRGGGKQENLPVTFDDLSHVEFRRKIETFIANQQKLIREELAVGGGFRKM
uniref:peptidyl-tRNA hydrolase n=1 Tax=Kalanchoe fedtschenkoi TaxID=63787 RepID=A0A7N0TBF7_KALFE